MSRVRRSYVEVIRDKRKKEEAEKRTGVAKVVLSAFPFGASFMHLFSLVNPTSSQGISFQVEHEAKSNVGDKAVPDLLLASLASSPHAFPTLEEARQVLRRSACSYRFYSSIEDSLGYFDTVVPSLVRVLSHSVNDSHFISYYEKVIYSMIMMKVSWLLGEHQVEAANQLGQYAFHQAVSQHGRAVNPVFIHLLIHNQVHSSAWSWTRGIRQNPLSWNEVGVADLNVHQAERALAPLKEASEELGGWQDSIEEMKDYQIAQLIVSRLYHPKYFRDKSIPRYLDLLRERTHGTDAISMRRLLRAELSVAAVHQYSYSKIDILNRFLEVDFQKSNDIDTEFVDMINLNLYAESEGCDGDRHVLDKIMNMDLDQMGVFLKRDKSMLLPSVRKLLRKRGESLDLDSQLWLERATDVPGDEV